MGSFSIACLAGHSTNPSLQRLVWAQPDNNSRHTIYMFMLKANAKRTCIASKSKAHGQSKLHLRVQHFWEYLLLLQPTFPQALQFMLDPRPQLVPLLGVDEMEQTPCLTHSHKCHGDGALDGVRQVTCHSNVKGSGDLSVGLERLNSTRLKGNQEK
eukprot:6471461-Amphidinium_carterae.7